MSNWLLNDVMLEEKVQVDMLLKFRAPGRDDAVQYAGRWANIITNRLSALSIYGLGTCACRLFFAFMKRRSRTSTQMTLLISQHILANPSFHNFARVQGPRQLAH